MKDKDKVNLIDMDFKHFRVEDKKVAIILMDMMLKKLHEHDYMVVDFNPNNIYYQDGIYYYKKVMPISSVVTDKKEDAVFNNVVWLSVFALWAYSPDPSNNLLNPGFVSRNFDNFSSWYPEEDKSYYRSIFVDSAVTRPNQLYFSDFISKEHATGQANSKNSMAYVKATAAGKAIANDDEAAFGHTFFLTCVVSSFTLILLGIIWYFVGYLG